ncbi:hypothetical protein [Spirosoma sp. KNUC1025]|uniref:hypothetical protein n=1 Tax=Spirosoma sp. KNUC1025 TaxID=2894082 RepID=UPI003869BD30|nr:hypothetical protein LN737_19505 [Spirosoma sp. KNUC1025]
MKATHLLLWFVCLLFASVEFFGCQDHVIPGVPPGSGPSRLRVKTLTQIIPPDGNVNSVSSLTNISAFEYDAQGRLGKINTFYAPSNTPAEVNTYQYDAQNLLTEHKREIVSLNYTEKHQYSYSGGQVNNILYLNNAGSGGSPPVPWFNVHYNYSNGILTSSKQSLLQSIGISFLKEFAYGFTDNNLTSLTVTGGINKGGPAFPTTSTSTSTYDNKVNPFYGVYIIPLPGKVINVISGGLLDFAFYGGLDNLLNLSRNNLLASAPSNTSYSYQYNGNNLPTQRITTTNSKVVETLTYEYETY